MERATDYRERATQCRDLAFGMSCPERRAQLRRAAEHWELLAEAPQAEPRRPASWRVAQAQDYLARAAEADGQAARGTGSFAIQLRGMARLWRGMAAKAMVLLELEARLARGDFDAPGP